MLVIHAVAQRIFGLSSAPESSRLNVGENVSDDLPKVGSAQRPMLQVLTVPTVAHRVHHHHYLTPCVCVCCYNASLWVSPTCTSRRRPFWADRCLNAPPGDCGSSYRCEAGRPC